MNKLKKSFCLLTACVLAAGMLGSCSSAGENRSEVEDLREEPSSSSEPAPSEESSQPEETVVPMREESSSIPDLDEDFGSQKSSSSLIDIEADDK